VLFGENLEDEHDCADLACVIGTGIETANLLVQHSSHATFATAELSGAVRAERLA
jgi:hypothetical protein